MVAYWLYITMPIIVWFVLSLFSRKKINEDDKTKRKYLIFCGIFIFLMMALRHYSVGSSDGAWYYSQWQLMSNLSLKGLFNELKLLDVENGYIATVWILTRIFKNAQFLFVFYGLFVSISVCRFIYKNCEDVVLSIMMFNCLGLWAFMVQGIRQGIAMCICLFAIEYCKSKRLVPFLLLIALAMLYHASAIVFVVAYLFVSAKMNVKWYVVVTVCVAGVMPLIDYVFNFVNRIINDTYAVGDVNSSEGGFATTMAYVLIVVLSVVFARNVAKKEYYNFFFYLTLCGMITFLMRYNISVITQRVAYYFMFGQIVALPALTGRIFSNSNRMKALVNMIIVLLCIGIAVYKSSYSVLLPYYFFWQ